MRPVRKPAHPAFDEFILATQVNLGKWPRELHGVQIVAEGTTGVRIRIQRKWIPLRYPAQEWKKKT